MYAKVSGGTLIKFPYTFGDLRRDNPNVSFPKDISTTTMNRYGMVSVREGTKPDITTYQKLERNASPVRPVIGQDEDGNDIHENYWEIGYTVVDMTAEEIAAKDETTAQNVRGERDAKLVETDWRVIRAYETGSNIPAEWELYRQALRDITTQEGFPHTVTWPVAP